MSLNLFSTLVGESQAMHFVYDKLTELAAVDAHVLILGETATGKDSAAYELHYESARADFPFVSFNCAAVPAELLESELFGHTQGAFIGAITAREGRLLLAQAGTLFLDEVEALPMPLQIKLLSALQQGEFYPLGADQPQKANFRLVVGASNQITQSVDEGYFSASLYALFRHHSFVMPPLRDRTGDMSSLFQMLYAKLQPSDLEPPFLDDSAVEALESYDWPGNIRELECLVETFGERYAGQLITAADLPERYQYARSKDQMPLNLIEDEMQFLLSGYFDDNECDAISSGAADIPTYSAEQAPGLVAVPDFDLSAGVPLKDYLQQVELTLIIGALNRTGGNVSQAAKLLQLNRTTLAEKIRKYDLKELNIA